MSEDIRNGLLSTDKNMEYPSNCTSCTPKRRLFSNHNTNESGVCHEEDGEEEKTSEPSSLDGYNPPGLHYEKTYGTIQLCIPNVSSLNSKVSTPFKYIANLPWRLAAKTEKTKRTSDVKFFSVYIDCNPESESTLWFCDAVVEFRLLTHLCGPTSSSPPFTRRFTNKFSFYSKNWGFPSFLEWNEIVNPENGYVQNDKLFVEARIIVQKVVGVRNTPRYDFFTRSAIADTCLLVDSRKIYVSKSYLALYSPVFHAMFYSNFVEKDQSVIRVEDVILDEFLELLQVIYPSHKPITEETVEYLLELGDKFEIQYVMDECEKFLINCEEIATITKLLWADQYFLAKLQDSCLRSITTVTDVKALKIREEYKCLGDSTKAALLEKVLKLVP